MEEKTPIDEKAREQSFEAAPKAINRTTLIAGIIAVIIMLFGILFIAGVFSNLNEAGSDNSNVETNVGP